METHAMAGSGSEAEEDGKIVMNLWILLIVAFRTIVVDMGDTPQAMDDSTMDNSTSNSAGHSPAINEPSAACAKPPPESVYQDKQPVEDLYGPWMMVKKPQRKFQPPDLSNMAKSSAAQGQVISGSRFAILENSQSPLVNGPDSCPQEEGVIVDKSNSQPPTIPPKPIVSKVCNKLGDKAATTPEQMAPIGNIDPSSVVSDTDASMQVDVPEGSKPSVKASLLIPSSK
ncbi:Vi polysaccharide biosynthesis UDP-N-acetylglucosamine C-6 dehydrogenase [Sesbania bispinosa]|nr:Vi polysaccharide biosynthesis UDP-N-acetylglucosamine C-6 dehydrogenase [Sesbania bispinosa]